MKRKLLILGIAALLLISGVMVGLAANDKSNVPPNIEEKPEVTEQVPPKSPDEPSVVTNVVVTQDRGFQMPIFRETVIVYFKEMPVPLEAFASRYGGKLIFAKPDIKLAAFETRAVGEPGKTGQKTLDFIDEVSKNSLVETAYRDGFIFTSPDKVYTIGPKITYPEDLIKQGGEYVPNEIIVGFWRMPPSLEEFATKYGVALKRVNEGLLSATFDVDDVSEFIKIISTDPYVRYVEPNSVYSIGYTPNDPKWNFQWGSRKIYTPEAWDYQKGSTGVTVAVLDTGVDYNHEDLAGRVIQGWNFVNNNSNPMDDHNHGTHVAGIVGAIMDNNKGIAGVAQVNILAVKVANSNGYLTLDNLAAGINYSADYGANIISMSVWGYTYSNKVEEATKYAYDIKGALLVAISGNAGDNQIAYPANYSTVIAVGATNSSDKRASFSNYDANLELVAPGVDINSTIRNNLYANDSGTSMAAPHVAGVAALVWSQNPSFSNQKVRNVLTGTAVDLGTAGKDNEYGYGKVNAYAAVTKGKLLSSNSGVLSAGGSYTYSVSVPAPSIVTVVMAGNENADFDLYAKWNSPPTTSSYDARGYSSTSLEYFPIEGSGTLYILVRPYSGSGNWKSWVLSGLYSDSGRKTGTLTGSGNSQTYSHSGTGIAYAFNSGPDGK